LRATLEIGNNFHTYNEEEEYKKIEEIKLEYINVVNSMPLLAERLEEQRKLDVKNKEGESHDEFSSGPEEFGMDQINLNVGGVSGRGSVTGRKIPKRYPKPKTKYSIMDMDNYEFSLKNCMIRHERPAPPEERPDTPWAADTSIFKSYLVDNDPALFQKCLDFDWANMKVMKYKKSEESDIKNEIRKIYPALREAYKAKAGMSPQGTTYVISAPLFIEFLEEMGCIDNVFKMADAEKMIITVGSGRREAYAVPKCIIRLQVVEYIIRYAV
jgi:hypothetical protein